MTQQMTLSQGLQTRLEQNLTPQQIQTMSILQKPSLELEQMLAEKMVINPVLEINDHREEMTIGDPLEEAGARSERNEELVAQAIENDENNWEAAVLNNESHGAEPMDYDAGNRWDEEREERYRHFVNSQTRSTSFQEALMEQLRDTVDQEKQPVLFRTCLEVLGNLDDNGWLDATDEEIAKGAEVDLKTVARAIRVVHSFTPAGLAARDLRECLLLQLERNRERGSIAWDIVDKHLEELSRNHIPQIAKEVDAEISEVEEARERIRELDPRPGRSLVDDEAPHIIPDFKIVKNRDGHWDVVPNEYAFPQVDINERYLALQKDENTSAKDRAYLRGMIEEANTLIQQLEYRKTTVEKVAVCILAHQLDFFERGQEYLKPMKMSDIADELDIHETTVSRAVANKYLDTPYGILEFKYFFSKGYSNNEGEDISNRVVQQKIREYIDRENKGKPLSDQKIADMLQRDGLTVARRTVTKYREAAGILAASQRKLHS